MKQLAKKYALSELIAGLALRPIDKDCYQAQAEIEVSGIISDSRHAQKGALFVALVGEQVDGHDYIHMAVSGGCSVVVCNAGWEGAETLAGKGVVVLEADDTGLAFGLLCAAHFGHPAERMKLIGVTGTNGKTTITYLLEQILVENGYSVGVIGTVNNRYSTPESGVVLLPTRFTTPEPYQLQEVLFEMASSGVEYVVMEVSSHALAQSRVEGLRFEVAAFTNLSRDHLDYHHNMEEYFGAKSLLFSKYLKNDGTAVLPAADMPMAVAKLKSICKENGVQTLIWGESDRADIRLLSFDSTVRGTVVRYTLGDRELLLESPLPGKFNVENLLTVLGICQAIGISDDEANRLLCDATGAPGRVERVSLGKYGRRNEPLVLVDYAHTPDALEKVLRALGDLPHNRLLCVFGCGGDRDRGKRPLMGQIGTSLSDIAIITSDNPRTELPKDIIQDIIEGLPSDETTPLRSEEWLENGGPEGSGYVVIEDRARAIDLAVRAGGPEDIILIAGKGHEPYQIIGKEKKYFDDRLEARRTLLNWHVDSLLSATGGKVVGGTVHSRLLGKIITDSRIQGKDTIFVALVGENHDGHDFVQQVAAGGAACVIVDRKVNLEGSPDVVQIQVEDTLTALGDLAKYHRNRLREISAAPVIAISGSCGKTTVKEMTACILEETWKEREYSRRQPVLKTKGNFNNLVGVPLTLLPAEIDHRALIIEMGANHAGELARLGEIASPDIGCITNVAGAHLEGFGSIEGVAAAKAELFQAIGSEGTLVVNCDDERVAEMVDEKRHNIMTFSMHDPGQRKIDVQGGKTRLLENGCWAMVLTRGNESVEIQLGVPGEHNLVNGLAAACLSFSAGATIKNVKHGLENFRPTDKRMAVVENWTGVRVINDTYNANPASMEAGIRTLGQMVSGVQVAVLGDMFELGDAAEAAHGELGRFVAKQSVHYLITVGKYADIVAQAAVREGMELKKVFSCMNKEEAVSLLREMVSKKTLGPGDGILVKASRGMRFETIVDDFLREPEGSTQIINHKNFR